MLGIGHSSPRTCQGMSRRELLQVGSLSFLGLSLPQWLEANESGSAGDVSCIFVWLFGGPSQLETFDPKPDAPVHVRGPYGTIKSNVPTIQLSELLPMLSQRMDRCALIRSMTGMSGGHGTAPILTNGPQAPSPGAVVAKLTGRTNELPPYVHLGPKLGVGGGNLGAFYNPVEVFDPSGNQVKLPQLTLPVDISADRFGRRRELLSSLDRKRAELHDNRDIEKMDQFYKRAIDILTSNKVREAFDLSKEKTPLRERYGNTVFGQSCLMARRLVEAGTRFVLVNWYNKPAWLGWDVHGADLAGLDRMESQLCPRFDQGITALLDDLDQRGLLKKTLVVAIGEMGRTPSVNKYGGRDHWGNCASAFLAGGGVPGGTVIGASDASAGYPADRPVTPNEFLATLYRFLGFNANVDGRVKPYVGDAMPVSELF